MYRLNYRSLLVAFAIGFAWLHPTASCSPVLAQSSYPNGHREWEVSGFVGQSSTGKHEFPTPVSGSAEESTRTVGLHHASGYQVGVRVIQNFNDFWGADLEYSFADQDLRFSNLSPEIPTLSLAHFIHHFSYNVSYLPLSPVTRLRPYVGAGIGTALFYIPGRAKKDALELGLNLRDSWEFVFNWGGGLKYLVADRFAVGFDVKDRISRVPSYGLPGSARVVDGQYQPGMARHGLLQNWQFNVGLTFQWDE
jgi:opacity protein-like surface antigen